MMGLLADSVIVVAVGIASVILDPTMMVESVLAESLHPSDHLVKKGGIHRIAPDYESKPRESNGRSESATPPMDPVLPITYHGGDVMVGAIHIYYIWYGNWSGNTAINILTNLAQSIGGSEYFNINTTYANSKGEFVSNSVAYKGSTIDSYSQGVALTDAVVKAIVSSAITAGALPMDPDGIYFVLTSAGVSQAGRRGAFCSSICGWHDFDSMTFPVPGFPHTTAKMDIKYAFVGNPQGCPACQPASNRTSSPNNNIEADAMASIIAHELEEAVTDPKSNAWFDANGDENGDKCVWDFGTTLSLPNTSRYNLTLSGTHYLVQLNTPANGKRSDCSHGIPVGYPGWTWNSGRRLLDDGSRFFLADVNGDGRADLIAVGAPGMGNAGWVYVSLSSGAGFPGSNGSPWSWNSGDRVLDDNSRFFVADVTGDGKADLVGVGAPGLGNAGYVYVSQSDGLGFPGWVGGQWTWISETPMIDDNSSIFIADVTGDRQADLVAVGDPRFGNAGFLYVSLARSVQP